MRVELLRSLQGDVFTSQLRKFIKDTEDLNLSREEVCYLAGTISQNKLASLLDSIEMEKVRRAIEATEVGVWVASHKVDKSRDVVFDQVFYRRADLRGATTEFFCCNVMAAYDDDVATITIKRMGMVRGHRPICSRSKIVALADDFSLYADEDGGRNIETDDAIHLLNNSGYMKDFMNSINVYDGTWEDRLQ